MKQLYATRLFYLFLIALFSFSACGDKEDVKPGDDPTSPIEKPSEPVEEPETPVVHKTPCRLIAISREDSPAGRRFEYNEKGLVSKIIFTLVSSSTGPSTTEILYHYNNKNQVIKMEYMQDGVISKHYSLSYIDGLLNTNKVYEGATLKYTETYTYNADKKVIRMTTGNRTLDYKYDSDGNVAEETATNTSGLNQKTTFENYDDMIEPYLSVTGYQSLSGGAALHNYTKITGTSYSNGEIISTYTDTYTYEYNEHKLPTKVHVSSSNSSSTFVINFTYECD